MHHQWKLILKKARCQLPLWIKSPLQRKCRHLSPYMGVSLGLQVPCNSLFQLLKTSLLIHNCLICLLINRNLQVSANSLYLKVSSQFLNLYGQFPECYADTRWHLQANGSNILRPLLETLFHRCKGIQIGPLLRQTPGQCKKLRASYHQPNRHNRHLSYTQPIELCWSDLASKE